MGMGMGFAPTWLRQVSPPPLLHKTTLTTGFNPTHRSATARPIFCLLDLLTLSSVTCYGVYIFVMRLARRTSLP